MKTMSLIMRILTTHSAGVGMTTKITTTKFQCAARLISCAAFAKMPVCSAFCKGDEHSEAAVLGAPLTPAPPL